MIGHNVCLSGAWNNDSTADLFIDCDPCPDAQPDGRGRRFTTIYDGDTLTWPQVSQLVADHLGT